MQLEISKLRKFSIVKQLDSKHVEIRLTDGFTVVFRINEGYPDSPTGVTIEHVTGVKLKDSDGFVESANNMCISSIEQAFRVVQDYAIAK